MHGLKKKRGKEDKPYSSGKKKVKCQVLFCHGDLGEKEDTDTNRKKKLNLVISIFRNKH